MKNRSLCFGITLPPKPHWLAKLPLFQRQLAGTLGGVLESKGDEYLLQVTTQQTFLEQIGETNIYDSD